MLVGGSIGWYAGAWTHPRSWNSEVQRATSHVTGWTENNGRVRQMGGWSHHWYALSATSYISPIFVYGSYQLYKEIQEFSFRGCCLLIRTFDHSEICRYKHQLAFQPNFAMRIAMPCMQMFHTIWHPSSWTSYSQSTISTMWCTEMILACFLMGLMLMPMQRSRGDSEWCVVYVLYLSVSQTLRQSFVCKDTWEEGNMGNFIAYFLAMKPLKTKQCSCKEEDDVIQC